ncbi:circumsporozoite protein-like, partial [Hippopotamus amphibius kiboko]|uniref:circumsporozoite protein-like n=1 Tax=Hippopotamus amphibius kiboko TaxID=575201 RepID=UPI00259651FF
MGKNGPVFVINPPLLQASQAPSGSAIITANPLGPAVPRAASPGALEGQVATARRLRAGSRARRRAGGAGVGEGGRREGGEGDPRRRRREQPPAAGEENGSAGRPPAAGCHGRGRACQARGRHPPRLNPGGRGGGGGRIAARAGRRAAA